MWHNKTQIHCINKTYEQTSNLARSLKDRKKLAMSRVELRVRFLLKKKVSHTFTTPFSLYSFHVTLSELNKIVYDVTHWGREGLPCVAKFVSSLSSPRSICNHWPASFDAAD